MLKFYTISEQDIARKNYSPVDISVTLTSSYAGAIVMLEIEMAKILDNTPILIGESRTCIILQVFQFRVN